MKAALNKMKMEHAMPAPDNLDSRPRTDWGGMPVGEWRRALDALRLVKKRVVCMVKPFSHSRKGHPPATGVGDTLKPYSSI